MNYQKYKIAFYLLRQKYGNLKRMRAEVYLKTKNIKGKNITENFREIVEKYLNLGWILEQILKKYNICFHEKEFEIIEVDNATGFLEINEFGEGFPIKEIDPEKIINSISEKVNAIIEQFLTNREIKQLIDTEYVMIIDLDEKIAQIWNIIDTPILPFMEKDKKYFKLIDIVSKN